MLITRDQIIQQAKLYVGIPFRHQGRSIEGLDCVGLLIMVAKSLNISHEDITNYGMIGDPEKLKKKLKQYLNPKSVKDRQGGDILLFAFPDYPCHVAIYTFDNHIIHALNTKDKVVEHRLSLKWLNWCRGCYEIPGVIE